MQSASRERGTSYAHAALAALTLFVTEATDLTTKRRRLAVAWLSTLVGELIRWSNEFHANPSNAEAIAQELQHHASRGGSKLRICRKLRVLQARLSQDFRFLDRESYAALNTLVGEHIDFPSQFISISTALSWDLRHIVGSRYSDKLPLTTEERAARLQTYTEQTEAMFCELWEATQRAQVTLLTTEEYGDFVDLTETVAEEAGGDIEFDVAISYASEDRSRAELLARHARDAGLRVFFDRFHTAALWGTNLSSALGHAFGARARYVVVLASAHYVAKRWTQYELNVIRAKRALTGETGTLVVRLEECVLPGIDPDAAHLAWTYSSPSDIVGALLGKLANSRSEPNSNRLRDLGSRSGASSSWWFRTCAWTRKLFD